MILCYSNVADFADKKEGKPTCFLFRVNKVKKQAIVIFARKPTLC
jgi:hypothetical protein